MKIKVNGEEKRIEIEQENALLSKALISMGYKPNTIVVELNNLIINSINWEKVKLKDGDNLVFYPFESSQSFEDGISKDDLDHILSVSNQGRSKLKINEEWHGSLNTLDPNQEYWMSSNLSFDFQFNYPEKSILNENDILSRSSIEPDLFDFNQS